MDNNFGGIKDGFEYLQLFLLSLAHCERVLWNRVCRWLSIPEELQAEAQESLVIDKNRLVLCMKSGMDDRHWDNLLESAIMQGESAI